MKEVNLGTVQTKFFDNYLILALSKKWSLLNNNKPIEFDVKLVNGVLVLSASLQNLERTKEYDNEM